jgi:hypothetical protein
VAVELEHVQGGAELELVRAALALRTKSVTAAHRRDLVLRLAAEDLAAAAETTREPAAAEAVIAWEVAEGVAVVAEAVVAVAEDGDKHSMRKYI